jgi:hypothetical protein
MQNVVLTINNQGDVPQDDKRVYYCPKCKSEKNRRERVRRSAFVKTFLFWLPLKRYACHDCKRKYYIWG